MGTLHRASDIRDRTTFLGFVDGVLREEKYVIEPLRWVVEPRGHDWFRADVHWDVGIELPMEVSGTLNPGGEWSLRFVVAANLQIERACSKGGHAIPGYHGPKHPGYHPEGDHVSDPKLNGEPTGIAVQEFLRRVNIAASIEMPFDGGQP